MSSFDQLIKTDDFKNEKHVPVIEVPAGAAAGQSMEIKVSVGKRISHPNNTAHHIVWLSLYFKRESGGPAYHLGRADFLAHGASTQGADSIELFTEPSATFRVKLDQPGRLLAMSYCNIHGLWEGVAELKF